MVENVNCALQDLGYGQKTDSQVKIETQTVGREIWQETLKNVKNEKYTLQDLDCDEKTEKRGKRNKDTVGP